MAPNKIYNDPQIMSNVPATFSKIQGRPSTRSMCQNSIKGLPDKKIHKAKDSLAKRKADQLSPPKIGKQQSKRSALADKANLLTNIVSNITNKNTKVTQPVKKNPVLNERQNENQPKQKEIVKISTIAETKAAVFVTLKPLNKIDIENVDPNAKAKPVKQCKNIINKENAEPKESDIKFDSIHKVTSSGKLSNKFRRSLDSGHEKSDESSLYTSALEEV